MSIDPQFDKIEKILKIDEDPKSAILELSDLLDTELPKLSEKVAELNDFVQDAVSMKIDGKDGEIGPQGERGERGEKGEKGDPGPQGEDGADGRDGVDGLDGRHGDDGEIGPMPKHEWKKTSLRFEEKPGVWGDFVDLKGERGVPGVNGGGSGKSLSVRNESGIIETTSAQLLHFKGDDVLVTSSGADTVIEIEKVPRAGSITRDGDGLLTSASITGGKTYTVTRDANDLISTINNGTETYNFTRDTDNRITSWSIT